MGKNLEEVVDMYRDCLSIDTVSLSQNIGLGKALNHGIDFCRNEIILRMDTDDVCVNDRFEKQINFLERNPAIALLGGAIDEYDEKMICPKGVRF
ncbi:glycosyltransferase [Apirhabdus apintestini]|nr:glycosyltransferase [Enterobacteriaceae bacterium CA-0114]